ncbi:hypothetical protein OAV41_02985 [Planctomycetota bacterium]|nr:hypothetical protein [Planctomycetota bacterium]
MIISAILLGLTPAVCFQEPGEIKPEQSSKQHQALATEKARRALRNLVDDFGHLGLKNEMDILQGILLELGDTPEDHEKLQKSWGRAIDKAKSIGNERARTSLGKKLEKIVKTLNRELEKTPDSIKNQLATNVLALDSESKVANKALGHILNDGDWLSPRAILWKESSTRIVELGKRARELEIVVEHATSSNPLAVALYGRDAHQVYAHGVRLHGGIAAFKLERILRESLRAMAFSKGILGENIEIPLGINIECVFLQEPEDYGFALEEALDSKGLSKAGYELQNDSYQGWLYDSRGWKTCRWRPEVALQAGVLFEYLGADSDGFKTDMQPCFLAGHLNWLCLNFFGCAMPIINNLKATEEGSPKNLTVAEKLDVSEKALWLSVGKSLFGCRAWMKAQMKSGEKYPYTLAIQSDINEIGGIGLLKATLMNEYLQGNRELLSLMGKTKVTDLNENYAERIARIEAVLGQTLPELEEEWAAWLLNEDIKPGILQSLILPQENPMKNEGALAIIEKLREVRNEAFQSVTTLSETVNLERELSAQCRKHARYLVLNPEQAEAWPDAHEEYADCEGFSPEGAWAGQHSVIHSTPDPVEAIDGWMATFYHRLPLLEPGLFGVGYGNSGRVTVLDTSSLVAPYWGNTWVVWPVSGANDVPLKFQPELPNPVPGEDQSAWGYPITLQAYWAYQKSKRTVEMVLYLGKDSSGPPVACHYITPTEPFFKKNAPADAYCLIPKATLKSGEDYTVVARCPETDEKQTWSFTTGH